MSQAKYRRSGILIWAALSPIGWIVMLCASAGAKTNNIWLAGIISFITLMSLFFSVMGVVEYTRSHFFFHKLNELEFEIDEYNKLKRNYIKLIEEQELKRSVATEDQSGNKS